jgi:hypothetical protein
MAWEPGQSGNPNGPPKALKPWREAINRAIKRREQDDPLALEKLADKLLSKVAEGDVAAIKEFGDRVDGKVPTPVGGTDELPPQSHVHKIERQIVDPANPNGEGVQTFVVTGEIQGG